MSAFIRTTVHEASLQAHMFWLALLAVHFPVPANRASDGGVDEGLRGGRGLAEARRQGKGLGSAKAADLGCRGKGLGSGAASELRCTGFGGFKTDFVFTGFGGFACDRRLAP